MKLRRIPFWTLALAVAGALLMIAIGMIFGVAQRESLDSLAPTAIPERTQTPRLTVGNSPMVMDPLDHHRQLCERSNGFWVKSKTNWECRSFDPGQWFPTPTPMPTPTAPYPPTLLRDSAHILLFEDLAVRDIGPGDHLVLDLEAHSDITNIVSLTHPDHYVVHRGAISVEVEIEGRQATVTFTAGSGGARISLVQIIGQTSYSEQGMPDGLRQRLPCFHSNVGSTDSRLTSNVRVAYSLHAGSNPEDDYAKICAAVRAEFPDIEKQQDFEAA